MRTRSIPNDERSSPARRADGFRVAVLGIVVVSVIMPLLPLIVQSVGRGWFYPDLLPDIIDLRAWRYVLSPQTHVVRAVGNSLVIAVSVTVLCVLVGVPAGRGLASATTRVRGLLEYLFLAPVIVPSLAVALGLHVAFVRMGLADRMAGVIVGHLLPTLPYMALVMSSTFAHANLDLEAQARTLGSGRVRAFLTVGVPSAMPGIISGSLFVFLISWSQYALTLLIGGGRIVTLPLLLFAFASAGDQAVTAALAIVFLVPAVAILALTARFLTGRSLALGGVGGR